MKLNLGTLFVKADQSGTADHRASTVGGPSDGGAAGDGPRGPLRILFATWVGLNAAVVIWLAVWNATLTQSVWDLIGSALLLGIGISCALAFGQTLTGSRNTVLTSMVSQIFVVGLAAYVWLVDLRSPVSQLVGIAGVALVLGGIALLWVLYFTRYARGALTKGATVLLALFPLIGLVEFWLQNEYLPESSRPLVDATAELSSTGSTGPVIHVMAKVTLHNRGSAQADVHAALMKVTAYPLGTPSQPATPDTMLAGLSPAGRATQGSFRETPTPTADARLLYAEVIASPYDGDFLAPGETAEFQRVIDVDSRQVRLVRLSVDGVIVTQRTLQDTHSCGPPQVSFSKDPAGFLAAAGQPHDWAGLGQSMCTESQFASRGVIQDLVSDHPVLRSLVVIDNPAHAIEVPALLTFFGTGQTVGDPLRLVDLSGKIEATNPASYIRESAEYAPSDADLHHPPG